MKRTVSAFVVTGFSGPMPRGRRCFKPTNYKETLQIRARDQITLEPSDPRPVFSVMGVVHLALFSGWFGGGAGQGGDSPAEVGATKAIFWSLPANVSSTVRGSELGPGRDGTLWVTTTKACASGERTISRASAFGFPASRCTGQYVLLPHPP